jgi:hypothetical protein
MMRMVDNAFEEEVVVEGNVEGMMVIRRQGR